MLKLKELFYMRLISVKFGLFSWSAWKIILRLLFKKNFLCWKFLTSSVSTQIRFATIDLELHTKYIPDGPESIYDIDQRVGRRTQVIPPLPEDRFLCSFSHIFAGSIICILPCFSNAFLILNKCHCKSHDTCYLFCSVRWICCWIL